MKKIISVLFSVVCIMAYNSCKSIPKTNSTNNNFKDTLASFDCGCGGKNDTLELISVPLDVKGRTITKTYLNYNPFVSKFFDYLIKISDTIFLIPGNIDTSLNDFYDHKEVFCILRDELRTYKREANSSGGFPKCVTYRKKYLNSSLNKQVYQYDLSSCGSLQGIPMLYYRRMEFTEEGEIVSFVWDDGDCVWDCNLKKN